MEAAHKQAQAEVFTNLVKKRFSKQKFDKFQKTLRDLGSRTSDPTYGVLELKKMFVGHQDLLILLNNFLPKNYHTIPTNKANVPDRVWDEQDKEKELRATMEFVNKVHERLGNNMSDGDGDDFIKFCDVMSMYQNNLLTVKEVGEKFKELFTDDPDLYVEFTTFTNNKERKKREQDNDEPKLTSYESITTWIWLISGLDQQCQDYLSNISIYN